MGNPNRFEWIDFAKAIGIFLVFIGHSELPESLRLRIYMFHMPLFFIISGFLWNVEGNKNLSFADFLKKKFKAYVIPYFKIAIVCLLIRGVLFNAITLDSVTYWSTLVKYIYGILIFSRGSVDYLPSCSPIWFLTCLFCAEVIFYWIMKLKKPMLCIIACFLIAFVINGRSRLVWNIDTAITVIPFLYIGMMMRKYMQELTSRVKSALYIPLLTVLSIVALSVCSWDTSYAGNDYQNMLLSYPSAIVISLTILVICKELFSLQTKKPVMATVWGGQIINKYVGRETLFLMGYNYMVNPIAPHFSFQSWLLQTFIGLIILSITCAILNKFPKVKSIFV